MGTLKVDERGVAKGGQMKVIVWLKSGRKNEVEIPTTKWSSPTPARAIEYAKDTLKREGHELNRIDHFEVEEDFL